MPLRVEPHAEPIPGYRLIERLGSGGFGEVWKAEAPGGLYKAIKFVQRGNAKDDSCAIGNTDPDRSRADQEMKSLSRIKTVHHPYIISLDRFEIVDDYLVIVMELADRTLSDRFKQSRGQGLPGVPRDELVNYLAEAAEALDLMNSMYQLQHLDIKPQNLFLVHNHIKVADFGLVKDITDQKFMTITGGVTPVYAAPETFDGKFSRQSDQYSLAIVYQEILTGHRPFTGTTMKQLILQHLQNAHDLTPAPVHDRPLIARALSKNPEDRFGTCAEFIHALRRAGSKGRPSEQAVPSSATAAPSPSAFPSVSKTVTARGGAGPVKPVDPNFSVEKDFLGIDSAPAGADGARTEGPRGMPSAPRDPSVRLARTPIAARRDVPTPRAPTQDTTGIVQPALVVGLGQLGVDTLSQLRQRIATELGSPFAAPSVRLIAIDTDPDTIQKATLGQERTALRAQEAFLARLQRPSHYLKTRDGNLPTDSWLNPKLLYRIPREQAGAGLRALGRLAFVDNYRALSKRLEGELHALHSQDTPHDDASVCDLGLRTTRPRVYLVSSLTGNTGSGMFLDVAYLLRKLLDDQGHEDAEIVGLLFVPHVQPDVSPPGPLTNAYASLVELKHYCRPGVVYSAHCETAASTSKAETVSYMGPPLQRCVLMPLAEIRGAVHKVQNGPTLAQASDFLYRDLVTRLGVAFEEGRHAVLQRLEDVGTGPLVQAIGMSRILWPRQALLQKGSRRMCTQLVTRWMQKDVGPMATTIRQWTHECWESLGMRPESLIERFQQLVENALQQKPEHLLAEVLGPAQEVLDVAPTGSAKTKTIVNMGPIVQTLDRLEKVLGIPDEIRSAKQINNEPSILERSFAEISHVIADECEQKLAELAVTLLEDPHYRLAGAEEALRQFCATVEGALRSQETLAKELADKAAQLHVRIQQWIDKPLPPGAPTSTQWSFGVPRRGAANTTTGIPSAADLFELLRTYTKTRYHSIVLSHLNRLYVGLRGHLSDQIREVGFCRQRLGELRGLLDPSAPSTDPILQTDRALFQPGCLNLADSCEKLLQDITVDDLIAFDERMQGWIKTHCQALLQICMGTATMVRNLAPAMLQEAEVFLSERVEGASVAEMYLTRKRAEHGEHAAAEIVDDLQRCLDDATPALGRLRPGTEVSIITLPNNAQGLELQKLLQEKMPGVKVLLADRQDEILFFHETVSIPWQDLEQLGPIPQEIYEHRGAVDPASLHTREDVFDWQLIIASKG